MKRIWVIVLVVVLVLLVVGGLIALPFIFRATGNGMFGMMGRGAFGRSPMMRGFTGFGLLRLFFGALIPLGLAFLAGYGVAALVRRSPRPAPPAPPKCPNCGHVVQSDWTACPYCGTKLVDTPRVEPPAEPPAV
jgi:hypothetical protein